MKTLLEHTKDQMRLGRPVMLGPLRTYVADLESEEDPDQEYVLATDWRKLLADAESYELARLKKEAACPS